MLLINHESKTDLGTKTRNQSKAHVAASAFITPGHQRLFHMSRGGGGDHRAQMVAMWTPCWETEGCTPRVKGSAACALVNRSPPGSFQNLRMTHAIGDCKLQSRCLIISGINVIKKQCIGTLRPLLKSLLWSSCWSVRDLSCRPVSVTAPAAAPPPPLPPPSPLLVRTLTRDLPLNEFWSTQYCSFHYNQYILQQISRTYSSSITETWYSLNKNSPFLQPHSPDKHCFYKFDCYRCLL